MNKPKGAWPQGNLGAVDALAPAVEDLVVLDHPVLDDVLGLGRAGVAPEGL
jgi:hypothetical protein